MSSALAKIPVGVIVERHKAQSGWLDFVYRPTMVLAGEPTAEPWTALESNELMTRFYAGQSEIELHRTETPGYRENLDSGSPSLWVALRSSGISKVGLDLFMVTADPAEGEALSGAGDDVVGIVPMPTSIQENVAAFISAHHVERPFVKRQRERSRFEAPRLRAGGAADET